MDWDFEYESEVFLLENLKLKYIVIPYDLLLKARDEDDKTPYKQRFILSVNDCEPWQGGVVSLGNQNGYITVKTAILKKIKADVGDFVTVKLKKDRSEFGMPVSEELAEVLRQDPEGEQRFRGLPIGKQRYIIYYVNQVKSSTKKIERAWTLISNLKKLPVGKEEFRGILGKE